MVYVNNVIKINNVKKAISVKIINVLINVPLSNVNKTKYVMKASANNAKNNQIVKKDTHVLINLNVLINANS